MLLNIINKGVFFMKTLNEKELENINGGTFPSNIGCGGGDGINFNPNNHGPIVRTYPKYNL